MSDPTPEQIEMVADLIEKHTYVMSKHSPSLARVAGLNSCATAILRALSAVPDDGFSALPASPSVPTGDAEGAVLARMVDRFLTWRLPANFNPDGGVHFDKERLHPQHWPSGTNLLDHTQATEMVRHMLGGND